jgi:parvulin-like peptidyl-prolyl isomerase
VQKGRSAASSIPGLEETLFKMKVGEMTTPQQFSGKWWIIRCLDHTRARVQPFEEVADESRIGAMVAKGLAVNEQQIRAGFAEFQRNANLQVFYPQYADIVNLSRGGAQAAKK